MPFCLQYFPRFLFTNNARLASIVGEKSIMAMISTLSDALEEEYGALVSRLYRVFKPPKGVSCHCSVYCRKVLRMENPKLLAKASLLKV